jgi:tRNA-intron endonuclease
MKKAVLCWLSGGMSNNQEASSRLELKIEGLLVEKGVKVSKRRYVDELSSRGYGATENGELLLAFYEALYLLDKGWLGVKDEEGGKVDFQKLLQCFEGADENAWSRYLAYRDLKSRGYTVREGFGLGVDFRVYERGEYGKDTAKYMVLSIQEGKPISLEDLTRVMMQCQSLKKELVLAVMNRRGEIVYYSVSQLTLK